MLRQIPFLLLLLVVVAVQVLTVLGEPQQRPNTHIAQGYESYRGYTLYGAVVGGRGRRVYRTPHISEEAESHSIFGGVGNKLPGPLSSPLDFCKSIYQLFKRNASPRRIIRILNLPRKIRLISQAIGSDRRKAEYVFGLASSQFNDKMNDAANSPTISSFQGTAKKVAEMMIQIKNTFMNVLVKIILKTNQNNEEFDDGSSEFFIPTDLTEAEFLVRYPKIPILSPDVASGYFDSEYESKASVQAETVIADMITSANDDMWEIYVPVTDDKEVLAARDLLGPVPQDSTRHLTKRSLLSPWIMIIIFIMSQTAGHTLASGLAITITIYNFLDLLLVAAGISNDIGAFP